MTPEAAFLLQAGVCTGLGSPFTGRLLTLLAPRIARGGPVYDRINAWTGDITARSDAVALRLAGGLHRLVLTRADDDLSAAYPPNDVDDTCLLSAVEAALDRHAAFFDGWLDLPPQTNEVRRSVVMIAAAHCLAARHSLPFRISELGASAGLNLRFDRYALALPGQTFGPADPVLTLHPRWSGPLPPAANVTVTDRRGVDLNPLDPANDNDRLRMLSYIWPDQAERLANTRAALDHARAHPVAVDRADAADWLADRLATPQPGTLHLVYNTIAWQYFPPATSARARQIIQDAGRAATDDTPLVWLAMEADDRAPGAGITLRLWPGDLAFDLGRVDFHGRWIDWIQPAI